MSAAEELTPAEREFIARLLLKLTGGRELDAPIAKVVRQRPEPRPEDFELVDRIRRKKGIR